MTDTYRFKGYDIPVDLMLMTGGGPDTFDIISAGHIHAAEKYVGIQPHFTVLEVGCGIGRDAIPLVDSLAPDEGGCYIGIDIIKRSIDWCQANIQQRNPNFVFHHMDIADQLHNPTGVIDALETKLPVENSSVDRIIAQSVLTHMLEPEVEHYLAEFCRVLKAGGRVFATAFIYDDDILASARVTNLTQWGLRFDSAVSDACRIHDPEQPTGAVAYTAAAFDRMVARAGLRHVRLPLKGGWSGYYPHPEYSQDALILTPA